jgi:hypothetical protein
VATSPLRRDRKLLVTQIKNLQPSAFPPVQEWVNAMLHALPNRLSPEDVDSGVLAPVNRLASHYMTHLCLASMFSIICHYESVARSISHDYV